MAALTMEITFISAYNRTIFPQRKCIFTDKALNTKATLGLLYLCVGERERQQLTTSVVEPKYTIVNKVV